MKNGDSPWLGKHLPESVDYRPFEMGFRYVSIHRKDATNQGHGHGVDVPG